MATGRPSPLQRHGQRTPGRASVRRGRACTRIETSRSDVQTEKRNGHDNGECSAHHDGRLPAAKISLYLDGGAKRTVFADPGEMDAVRTKSAVKGGNERQS